MRTWRSDDPKAALMTRKRDAIVAAALRAFLAEGYEGSSVNRIAEDAGVSIKTLYRHFTGKEDLFGAVIAAACTPATGPDAEAPWLVLSPDKALPMMAEVYLRDVLSKDQILLYRLVVHDSARVPAVGRMYYAQIVEPRREHFVQYATRWAAQSGWPVGDWRQAAEVFAGLLDAGVLSPSILLNSAPNEDRLIAHAEKTASDILFMITSRRFAADCKGGGQAG